MTTTFFETPRFPDSVSEGATGGPAFSTSVFEAHAGLEQRSANWSTARHVFNIGLGIRTRADMDTVREIFYLARGKYSGFRFKDWCDYKITSGNIGTGNGATTVYDIVKKYTVGSYTYTRRILKPVSGTVSITVNGVAKTEGVDYTVDYTTGEVTFSVAPSNGHAIVITCEFDVPVRFDTDEMFPTHAGYDSEEMSSVKLIEILYDELDF